MKTITLNPLDPRSIDAAIREIKAYKTWLTRKCAELRKRIADEIQQAAQQNFDNAWIDDLIPDGSRKAEVTVTAQDDGKISLVIASGEDGIWAEFGAGKYWNGSVGGSPHPKGNELGFTIGGYGRGLGKYETWRFKDGGELKKTHGTQAQMPLWNALQEVSQRIESIAKDVFSQ